MASYSIQVASKKLTLITGSQPTHNLTALLRDICAVVRYLPLKLSEQRRLHARKHQLRASMT